MERLPRWWFPPVAIALAVVGSLILNSRYDVSGHAAGHLGSANAVFPMTAAFAIVVWATPGAARRASIWVAGAVLEVGLLVVAVGNLRVVDAIGTRDLSDDAAGRLGPTLSGFESGHHLIDRGMVLCVLGAVLLTWALFAARAIPLGLAIGATAASLLFPPWILPGAGVVVLAIAQCVRRARRPLPLREADGPVGEDVLLDLGGARPD
jgi:hypothetical protein